MQYLLSINALITGITALVFGVIVIKKDRKNIINVTLFLLTLATALWMLGYWKWMQVYDNAQAALLWCRILSIGSTMIPVFYFHWILSLIGQEKKNRKLLVIFYSLATFFLLFSFSSAFIKSVEPVDGYFAFWPKAGYLYTLYLFGVYLSVSLYSIFLLIKTYKNTTGLKRLQIKYVLLGSILGYGGGATNFFLWYDIPILPYGSFLIISYPLLFTYSIVKHRLMDIKLVARKYLVYLFSVGTVLVLSLSFKYLITRIVFIDLSLYLDIIVVAVSISIFPSVRKQFHNLANKYFFSSLYDSQEVVTKISDRLRSTLDIEEIYEIIHDTLESAMHFKKFSILGFNERNKHYYVQFNSGFDVEARKKFPGNEALREFFVKDTKPLLIDDIKKNFNNNKTKKTIELLNEYNIEVMVSLSIKGRPVGILVFGAKESGDMYNEEDLRVLNIVSAQAAIAIENALLYEETKNFNIKLKDEIAKATEELRIANEELKQLDRAKSEFISIASHQLRTPLTAVKGFVSMILQGDFGKINKKVDFALGDVYESNERLIHLINDLLDVSRIESGRLLLEFKVQQLEDLVESVFKELKGLAEKKGLKFTLHMPKEKLPPVNMDEAKVRQVVMNLTDNAIKYTEKGFVKVTLKREGDKAIYCVEDSGRGVSEHDLRNLFKKFSRGKGSSVVHTEGTGLGLYVAKQMIENHSGTAWAESEGEWKGSKFCFSIPFYKENRRKKKKKKK